MDLTSTQNLPTKKAAAPKTTRVAPGKLSAKTLSPEGHINKVAKKAAATPVPKGPGLGTGDAKHDGTQREEAEH